MVEVNSEVGEYADEELLALLEAAAIAVVTAENAGETDLSITLLDDAAISRLNLEYLGHDGPTDVISFRLETPFAAPTGDIYLGAEQAVRQAEELGVPVTEELVRLTVHGVLHVLGWDHPDEDRQDSPMYRRQEEILRVLETGGH
jgi:probable rRNA maturation factor